MGFLFLGAGQLREKLMNRIIKTIGIGVVTCLLVGFGPFQNDKAFLEGLTALNNNEFSNALVIFDELLEEQYEKRNRLILFAAGRLHRAMWKENGNSDHLDRASQLFYRYLGRAKSANDKEEIKSAAINLAYVRLGQDLPNKGLTELEQNLKDIPNLNGDVSACKANLMNSRGYKRYKDGNYEGAAADFMVAHDLKQWPLFALNFISTSMQIVDGKEHVKETKAQALREARDLLNVHKKRQYWVKSRKYQKIQKELENYLVLYKYELLTE